MRGRQDREVCIPPETSAPPHLREIPAMKCILSTCPRLAALALGGLVTVGVSLAQQATTVGTLDGHTDPVYSIAWSPDGKLVVTGGFDNTVRIWDSATRKELKKLEGHSGLV